MFSKFHLAFKVPCISEAKKFYCGVLGCDEGRSESGWADINFFGNSYQNYFIIFIHKKI